MDIDCRGEAPKPAFPPLKIKNGDLFQNSYMSLLVPSTSCHSKKWSKKKVRDEGEKEREEREMSLMNGPMDEW